MGASLHVLSALARLDRPVFTTREVALVRGASVSTTGQALARLADKDVLVRASRGLWVLPHDPRSNPYDLVPFLAGEHRAYVSFISALYLHGRIDQVPRVVHAATTAHTRRIRSAVGDYSFHHVDPDWFHGFEARGSFLLATPEKALVDCLYLASRRGRSFSRLPELDLGEGFDSRRARDLIRRIGDARIRSFVLGAFEGLLAHARGRS